MFDQFEEYTPRLFDQQLDQWYRFLWGMKRAADQASKVAPSGASRSSGSNWALGKIRTAATEIVASSDPRYFPEERYTIHHKISRSNLHKLFSMMQSAGSMSAPLSSFLQTLASELGTTSQLKALLNMPANLEVGPQDRIEDPGSGFDPNPSTPRSGFLGIVNSMISDEKFEWSEIARLLIAAHSEHGKRNPTKLLSSPILDQWGQDPSGKFIRNNK